MEFRLLTSNQSNKLHSLPKLEDLLNRKIALYVSIANRVRISFPEFNELDRVDLVSDMIKKTDADVYGIEKDGMSVDEACDIFARVAVGRDAG